LALKQARQPISELGAVNYHLLVPFNGTRRPA